VTLRRHPPNAAERRDEMMRLAHGKAEKAADRAMRRFLRQVMAAIRGAGLTASIDPVDPFTVEQARQWWAEASEQDLLPALRAIWRAGYSDTSTVASSSDDVARYFATVSDRLSPTTSPSLPHDAFDLARRALTEELAAGSSIPEIGRRLAAEFSWEQDAPYWESRKLDAQNEIDAILDPLGEPGSYAREAAKRSDPRVVALRQISNEATLKLDSLEGPWRARATLIARTESTGAFNHAGLSALNDEGAERKVWLATLGPRTRPEHAAASGQEVPLDQPFDVGGEELMYPGDPAGSAANCCNCRCTMIGGGL
jgi:glutathione S-transferase